MGYRVTAACVVAKVQSDTGEGYFYRDAVLPDGVSAEECKRLEALGLVEKEKESRSTAKKTVASKPDDDKSEESSTDDSDKGDSAAKKAASSGS